MRFIRFIVKGLNEGRLSIFRLRITQGTAKSSVIKMNNKYQVTFNIYYFGLKTFLLASPHFHEY